MLVRCEQQGVVPFHDSNPTPFFYKWKVENLYKKVEIFVEKPKMNAHITEGEVR